MARVNRLAVVTGTSAGVGLAVARRLLSRGWSVLGVARRPAPMGHEPYRHERLDLGDLPAVEAFLGRLATDPGLAAAHRLGGMALAAEAAAGVGGTARDLAVVSYRPGMVDTAMQAENRAASPEDLPDAEMFRALQAAGRLVPPERPALEIAAFLDRDDLPGFSEHVLEG